MHCIDVGATYFSLGFFVLEVGQRRLAYSLLLVPAICVLHVREN